MVHTGLFVVVGLDFVENFDCPDVDTNVESYLRYFWSCAV